MAHPVKQEDLDDVLEKALDDFDEDELVEAEAAAAAPTAEKSVHKVAAEAAIEANRAVAESGGDGGGDDELASAMASLMDQMGKPEFNDAVEGAMRELSGGEGGSGSGGLPGIVNPFAAGTAGVPPPPPNAVDKSVAQALDMMAGMSRPAEGVDPAATEAMGEDVMKAMMEQFERMGEKEDFQSIVDNMMKQMLSKDIMYVPMKQISEKFPEWLADNESTLSKEDYERYGRQYQFFQQIVAVYETEPDNMPKLMELMQDMQETGQPPAEIIKELAPGMQFSEDGMPMLPNMGPGMPGMPTVPGMGGMPGDPGQCAIM